jgi:hypothetical protein
MKLSRRSETELLVEDSCLWIAVVCAIAAAALVFAGFYKANRGTVLSGGLFLLFAVFWIRKSTFSFDSARRVVNWNNMAVLKRTSGSLGFDEITGVGMETSAVGSNGALSYRLTLLTRESSVPLSDTYGSGKDRYAAMREELLGFIGTTSGMSIEATSGDGTETSVRSLLRQGRKIDAVSLMRTMERLNLMEAVKRVEGIEHKMKAEAAR